jgi:hypothetical protein
MHICSGAQIKIEYASEHSIFDLFQTILHFESWSLYCIMFLVFFFFLSWLIGITIASIMGFPFLSGSCKFASWVLYILEFVDISKCSCFVLLKKNATLYSCLPSPRTWVVWETIVKLLSPIMISYVLNQNHGHWLLGKCLAYYNVNKSS